MSKRVRGFTIVELLIVIVVIAILAAITILAYNGIQQRARNDQVIAGVQQYIKAISLYAAAKGQFPITTGDTCLGANYPSNQCWVGTNGNRTVNTTFDTNLAEFMLQKPTLATTLMQVTTTPDMRAGATFRAQTGQIVYYLDGAGQSCVLAGSGGVTELQTTQCAVYIPLPT